MAYVNKQNLSDFWTNAKRYIAARDADQCDWISIPVNAPVYRFEAEPRTPVNPVVEFGFTETPPASGEKGPDNPSTITGVDSITVTRRGKNIITPFTVQTSTTNGITFTADFATGTITANGTATANAFYSWGGGQTNLPKDVTMTLSGCPSGGSNSTYLLRFGDGTEEYGNGNTFTIGNKSQYFAIKIFSGVTVSNLVFKPQLEFGSTATSFEPPSPVSATVNLGETRYGGTLDVATGKLTVTQVQMIVDQNIAFSSNTFGSNSATYRIGFFPGGSNAVGAQYVAEDKIACDRIPATTIWPNATAVYITSGSSSIRFFLSKSDFGFSDSETFETVSNAFKTWLGEHPLKIVYPVSPFTIDLSPQQLFSALSNSRVNTVFTDIGTIAQLTYAKPAPRQEDVFRFANWHKTETAGIVTCCPVPESELHPVVNFSFTETLPAEGEKGPENPSTISGVTEIEVVKTGKNLAPTAIGGMNYNDGIIVSNNDGSFTLNGTTRQNTTMYVGLINPSSSIANYKEDFLRHGCTYTFSVTSSSGTARSDITLSMYKTVNGAFDWINRVFGLKHGESATYTILPNTAYHLRFNIASNATFNNETFFIQIEEGESSSAFEKSLAKQNSVINLNGTYYGGSIDLSTGLMTVTHVKCIADGTNIYAQSSVGNIGSDYRHAINVVTVGLPAPKIGDYINSSSTHFSCITGLFDSFGVFSQASQYIIIPDANGVYQTNQSFNDWLKAQNAAGTPVEFVYTVATPFTIQLTPQQLKALPALDKYSYRVNTLYTDADSIQVGYMKSPIKTEEEFNNAILALGGNL